jgi:hypothetical protein
MQYSRPADFEYLVLWNKPEITPLSNQSWLPAQNFDNPNAVIDYWKRRQDIAAPNFLLGGIMLKITTAAIHNTIIIILLCVKDICNAIFSLFSRA